jgi:site-specific DNA recombinase
MNLPPIPQRGRVPRPNGNHIDLEAEFNRIGDWRGYLGAAHGQPAYAYVRVSSEGQTEEGRSGLPRQLLHIHELALKGVPEQGVPPLQIPWTMVYADEGYSGFEFNNRPSLNALLQETTNNKRSPYILIEHLDRLSRHATWHQGYLLEQFERAQCQVLFWRSFSSAIERSVMGAIAEQGMRHEIQRMMDGQVLKARSGRVTAKRARFGYMFVNSRGEPQATPGSDTHYALDPEQARVIRWIYEALIHERKSLGEIARLMNEGGAPCWEGPVPVDRGGVWHVPTLANMVKNPVYKGEFFARRHYFVPTGETNAAGRPKLTRKERPREEWIPIQVPAIVTPKEWALAQACLEQNRKRSPRNTKSRDWLLSGLIRCARCGYTWSTILGNTPKHPRRYYGCVSRDQAKARADGTACVRRRYLRADLLEPAIWQAVLAVILDPETIIDSLSDDYQQRLAELRDQQAFLMGSLEKLDGEFKRWNQAYGTGVIDLEELKNYRADITRKQEALRTSIDEVAGRLEHLEGLQDKDNFVRELLAVFRGALLDAGDEPPPELKRKILRHLVDTIWVDHETLDVKIEGAVSSEINLEDIGFESLLGLI